MKFIKTFIVLLMIILIAMILINIYIVISTKNLILDIQDEELKDADCILILGAGIRKNRPSPMLEDRLLMGIELYNKYPGKILVSGDHINDDYNEVNVMKEYLYENDIPKEKIFVDHYGISSYDSLYRAKKIYKANKIIIITQKYHLYRSLYIGKKLDLEVYGLSADKKVYVNQRKRDIREFFARIKDFFKCMYEPTSEYLGEVYNIKGNGEKTHKKNNIS